MIVAKKKDITNDDLVRYIIKELINRYNEYENLALQESGEARQKYYDIQQRIRDRILNIIRKEIFLNNDTLPVDISNMKVLELMQTIYEDRTSYITSLEVGEDSILALNDYDLEDVIFITYRKFTDEFFDLLLELRNSYIRNTNEHKAGV